MRSCAVGSSIGGLAFAVVLAMGACHQTPEADSIPPVTSARANTESPVISDGPKDASVATAVVDASTSSVPDPPKAAFHDTPYRIEDGPCERVLVAVAKGTYTIANEKLDAGDVIVFTNPQPTEVKSANPGLVLEARIGIPSCVVLSRPAAEKTVVRANAAAKLEWAGGKMSARLDVGVKVSPDLYLGRLEGTGAVAEHVHAGSW